MFANRPNKYTNQLIKKKKILKKKIKKKLRAVFEPVLKIFEEKIFLLKISKEIFN
jgi:hypothetical protein